MPARKNVRATKAGAFSPSAGATLTRLRHAEEADLDGIAKALLHVLIRAADNATGEVRMTQAELARRTGFSENRMRERLVILLDAGYIKRKQRQTDARGHPIRDLIIVAELTATGSPISSDRQLKTPTVAVKVGKATPTDAPKVGPATAQEARPNRRSGGVSRRDRQAVSSSLELQSPSSTSSQTPNSNLLRAFIDSKMKEPPADKLDVKRESARPQLARRRISAGRNPVIQPRSARSDLPIQAPTDAPSAGTKSNSGGLDEIRAELADVPWPILSAGIYSDHEAGAMLAGLGFEFSIGEPAYLLSAPDWYVGPEHYNAARAVPAEVERFRARRTCALRLIQARQEAAA